MISYLSGNVKNINEKYFTLLTSSGVGYKVFTNIKNLLSFNENQKIEMLIHTIIKDDAIDLYGFLENNEMEMFEKLISVSSIGPKTALNILSTIDVESLAQTIENDDLNNLKIIGLGKKSLEKIKIELKGKLSHLIKNNLNKKNNTDEADARLALISLGYNEKDINNAINEIKKENDFENMKVNEIIKIILKYLK